MSIELEQIEANIQMSRKVVDIGESLERLITNRDFKKIVMNGYFEQEAIHLVHLKSDPSMQGADSQKAILVRMDAIGSLAQYLKEVRGEAVMANKNLVSDEQARDELLVEGL